MQTKNCETNIRLSLSAKRTTHSPVSTFLYHLESRWPNSHVLVYHGPLLSHLLGVAPSTFTMVYYTWRVYTWIFLSLKNKEDKVPPPTYRRSFPQVFAGGECIDMTPLGGWNWPSQVHETVWMVSMFRHELFRQPCKLNMSNFSEYNV